MRKALGFALVSVLLLPLLILAFSDGTSNAYQIQTIHVFPDKVSGDGWRNVEAIGVQNLQSDSLYQDFNEINSAYPNPASRDRLIEEPDEPTVEQTPVPDEDDVNRPASQTESSETDVNVPTAEAAESTVTNGQSNDATNTEETIEQLEPVIETSQEPTEIEVVDQTTDQNADSAATSTEVEPVSLFKGLETVGRVFGLALAEIKQSFPLVTETTTSTDDQTVSDEAANVTLDQALIETQDPTPVTPEDGTQKPTTTESSLETGEHIVADIPASSTQTVVTDDVEGVSDEQISTTTQTDTYEPESEEIVPATDETKQSPIDRSEPQPEPQACTENCSSYILETSGFGLPLLDNFDEFGGAQLRLSLAAKRKPTRDIDQVIAVEYKIGEGADWLDAGAIFIGQETSNSINGGYYLFSLDTLSRFEQLDTLSVRIVYKGNLLELENIYIDSLWLEVHTVVAPDITEPFDLSALDNGYETETLTGDLLLLNDDEAIEFDFTDDTSDEGLIIKSSEKTYTGLTSATTYFSVTNESNKSDTFSIQTYFPDEVGDVSSLELWEQNVPKEVVIPEYRPFVYHCDAGWEQTTMPVDETLSSISQRLAPSKNETDGSTNFIDDELGADTVATSSAVEELGSTSKNNLDVSSDSDPFVVPEQATTTEQPLIQASVLELVDNPEEAITNYMCRNTSIVRACDEFDGDNTACRVNAVKVAEHDFIQYESRWVQVDSANGRKPDERGFFKKAVDFLGFGVDTKPVPETFEPRVYADDEFEIGPGETKYFKMDIDFPAHSSGEFWIETVGNREYGLLDPYWKSQWTYRMPITIDNSANTSELTEQQIRLQFDSSLTDFWTNVASDGSDIRFVRQISDGTSGDWYSSHWQSRTGITIHSTAVPGTLTDFPVYVDLADLGSDFWDTVAGDGSDIRITSGDGRTELPLDLVTIDTSTHTGELHFLADSVSSSTDTTFYVYYDNPNATAYDSTDAYGRNAVWKEYEAVYHFAGDPTVGETDYSGNGKDLLPSGTGQATTSGQLGNALDLTLTTSGIMIDPDWSWVAGEDMSSSGWYYQNTVSSEAVWEFGVGSTYLSFMPWYSGGTGYFRFGRTGGSNFSANTTPGWHHFFTNGGAANGTNVDAFVDTVLLNSLTQNVPDPTNGPLQIGRYTTSGSYNGYIDELRFSTTTRSTDWIEAEYANQLSPNTFYATSSSPGLSIADFVELDFWLQHFDSIAEEADVWVQVDTIPAAATSTIYVYYGASGASNASNEWDTFTYSSPQPVYYVVDDSGAEDISIVSLIDNNVVTIDGSATTTLDAGESVTYSTFDGDSVIAALGPISGTVTNNDNLDGGDTIVPISFATTSFAIPTNRGSERWYVHAPFGSTTVSTFIGGSASPTQTLTAATGTAITFSGTNPSSNNGVVIEASSPVLVMQRSADSTANDGLVAYPPTLEDLYGFYSNNLYLSATADNPNPNTYCSGGDTGSETGITRGELQAVSNCSNGPQMTGNAVRFTGQSTPLTAIQQADADGNESTVFWAEKEFGTKYAMTNDSQFVAVICSPRYGASTIEVRNQTGTVVGSGTCTPSGSLPGALHLGDTTTSNTVTYSAGHTIVSTNGVPFYAVYEDVSVHSDEKNITGSVQARKYVDTIDTSFGAQEYSLNPEYEQLSFAWYENDTVETPTTFWSVGDGQQVSEGVKIDGEGAVNPGDVLRLRINVADSIATTTAGGELFDLQYTQSDTCTLTTNEWAYVGDIGSSTASFRGYNNSGLSDNDTLSSTTLSLSTVLASYEEENHSEFNPYEIGVGEVAEWDWVIEANQAAYNSNYCFRMVRADGGEFSSYTTYAQLETAGPPTVSDLLVFFDNETTPDSTPQLEFAGTDRSSDDIHYQVQIDDDRLFGSPLEDKNSISSFNSFQNLNIPSDKAPFNSGSQVRFTSSASLVNGTTYYWRVRGRDPDGTDEWGDWSEVHSFTADSSAVVSEWRQTTGHQFSTNILSGLATSTGGVSVSGASGSMTSTPIDFDDGTVGNAWGSFSWNDTETSGTIVYQVEYLDGGSWSLIPDTALTGNSTGFSSSPVNLLGLDTNIYNEIRLVATFSGTTLSIEDWSILWGERVEIPTLDEPFDNEKIATTTPTFVFFATDPQSDRLEYEISWSDTKDFTSSTTRNSTSDGGFINQQNGADTSPFVSGDSIAYPLPVGDAFVNGSTKWWRARAKDPSGGDAWSPWSEPSSLTVDTSVVVSTWFQTTKSQFQEGELTGLKAQSNGTVAIDDEVGEYGTVTLTDNNWTTVTTNLSYNNMVVVASPEYTVVSQGDNRNPRVRNKTSNSFEIKVDDYTDAYTGTTQVDYVVMEAGTWTIDDGGSGLSVFAGTEADVTDVQTNTYSDALGSTVALPAGHFSSNPIALATISSNNDSSWVGTHVDNGSSRNAAVTATGFRVAMARSMDSSSAHGPEDIDYILLEPGTGTNNSVTFETVNTGAFVVDSFGSTGYSQALSAGFSSAPAVTVVNNNAESGGNGGFALKDLSGTNNASQIFLSIIEGGSGANGHTGAEVVSVLAFEDSSGIIKRQNGGDLTGTISSEAINFTDGTGPKFEEVYWSDAEPGSSSLLYQIQYFDSDWQLIPDGDLPGNSSGFGTGPVDLSGLNVSTYQTIRLLGNFACVSGSCPTLSDWTLTWAEGVQMSGTFTENDRVTPVSSGTIRVAVNGTLLPSTGTVSAGTWTVNNVTAFAGDVVTVFVDGAADTDEAVNVFVYDGSGDMTNVSLSKQHLTFDSDETATTTNALLSAYDYSVSADEDIFFDVDANNDLTLCAVGACIDNSIYIGSGHVYQPDSTSSGNVNVHDLINDGTFKMSGNTIRVSGSWIDTGEVSTQSSSVIFTATTSTETMSNGSSTLTFNNLTFGEGSGNATWITNGDIDINGNLAVNYGTLSRASSSITVAKNLTTGASGYWVGSATTTFDGSVSAVWSDYNPTPQNIGDVIIDGSVKTVTIATDVAMYDITIGADDTFSGGGSHTIYVAGDWTNNHTFTPQTSEVIFVEDDRIYSGGGGGSVNWYDSNFGQRQSISIQASQVDEDLNNFPVYIDLASLGSIFWSAVNSDGSDIRITTSDGMTELAYDLVDIDTMAHTGELHFLAPYISSTTDSSFYIYYDNSLAAGYGPGDPYGAYAVWDEYEAVYHFNEDPAVSATDYTGNGYDLSPNGTGQVTAAGQLGDALDLTGTTVGIMTDNDWSWTGGDNLTSSGWYHQSAASNESVWAWGSSASPDNIEFRPWYTGDNGLHYFGRTSGATYTFARVAGWHHFTTLGYAANGEDNLIYEDGILRDTITQNVANPANSGALQIGRQGTSGSYNGKIDELRFTMVSRTEAWIDAEYYNQGSPNTFYATSTAEAYDPGDATAVPSHTVKTNGSSFYKLTFNDATTTVAFTEANLTVLDDVTIATGTVTLPTGITTIGGSFLNSGGIFSHNNASLRFTSSGNESVTLLGDMYYNHLYNVSFTGSGSWTFTDANATTSGSMTISNGTVTFPATKLTIKGGLSVTGSGAFNANGGLVQFLPTEDQTIRANNSVFNDVVFGSLAASFGWYDVNWLGRSAITIQSSAVPSDLTNYPVYIDLSDLGDAFWGGVQSDGADIRVTTGNGTTEVPYDLVSIDTTTRTGELHFKAPLLSSGSDTIFYIYYNNVVAPAYADTDPYGAYAVWDEYEAVYHFEDDPNIGVADASGHGKDLSPVGTGLATTSGPLGAALDLTGTTIGYLTDPDWSWQSGDNLVSSGLYYQTALSAEAVYQFGTGSNPDRIAFMPWYATDRAYFYFGRTYSYIFTHTPGWHHFFNIGNTVSGQYQYMYEDGVANGTITQSVNNPTNNDGFEVGRYTTAGSYNGYIDELRLSTTTRPAAWAYAEHVNHSSTTNFYATSTGFANVDVLTLTDVNVNIDGDVSIGATQVVGPSGNLAIAGSFSAQGLYEAGSGTVTFDSDDAGETIAAGGNVFYNLVFNNAAGGWTITEDIAANNDLTLTNAANFAVTSGATVGVGGVFSSTVSASSTTWTNSTLRLFGVDHTVHEKNTTGDDYATIQVEGDADIVIWNSTVATTTFLGTGSLYLPDYGGADGVLRIYGDYDGRGDTEYWSYATDFDGTDLSAGSAERSVSVLIASSSNIMLSDGLTMNGVLGASTTVSALTGTYTLTTEGGVIDAGYFEIGNLGSNGWSLTGATTSVADMHDGLITVAASSTGLTVDADIVTGNPAKQFYDVAWVSAGANVKNVTLNGLSSSYWWFRNGTGDLYGEAFDNDDGDPGSIQWDDSQYSITIQGVVYADDGVTPLGAPVCDGVSPVVKVVVDGTSSTSAPCNPLDGSYVVRGVSYEGNPKIVTYLDHDAYAATPASVTFNDQQTGSGTVVGNGSVYVDRPSVQNGDILIAVFGKDDDLSISAPSGWVEAATLGLPSSNQQFTGLWYKPVVDAETEPTMYEFVSNDNDTESYSYWIGSFTGVDLGDPFDVTPAWTTQLNNITPPATSVTTVTDGSMVLAAWYVDNDIDVDMPGGSWTTLAEDIVDGGNNLSIARRLMATAGATGDVSISNIDAGSDDTNSGQFVLKRATYSGGTTTAAVVTHTPIINIVDTTPTDVSLRFAGTGIGTVDAGTTFTVDRPGTAQDDLLLLVVGKDDEFDITPPSGWTAGPEVATISGEGSTIYSAIWYRVVTDLSTEPTSYNFTSNDNSTENYSYWIGSFDGVDLREPFDVSGTWEKYTNEPSPTATSITTTEADSLALAIWYMDSDSNITMPGGSWTTVAEDVVSGGNTLNIASRLMSTAGATGNATITNGGTGSESHALQLALKADEPNANTIGGFDMYANRVIVRHEDSVPVTIADLAIFDSTDDSDIPYTATTGTTDTLAVSAGHSLYVFDSMDFAPGGDVTVFSAGTGAVHDGGLALGPNGQFIAAAGESHTIGGGFRAKNGAAFVPSTSLVTFNATTTGAIIAASSTQNFYDVVFDGVGGQWDEQATLSLAGNLDIVHGTLTGAGSLTLSDGSMTGDGVVSMTGGTVTIEKTNTFGGVTPWTFANLTFGSGSIAGTTTRAGTATTTVTGQLRVNTAHNLLLGTGEWELAGNGTVVIKNGSITPNTSTVLYSGSATVYPTTYYNLVLAASSLPQTMTLGSTGINITNDLTVGGATSTTVTANTLDPVVAVGGDMTINPSGTYIESNTNTLDLGGSLYNSGTFSPTGGLVEFSSSDPYSIATEASNLGRVELSGAGLGTVTENATSTGAWTIDSGASILVQPGVSLAVGGAFTNNAFDSATTWTNSTLHLFGGSFTANQKSNGDAYDIVSVAPDSHVKFWDSTFTAVETVSSSSVYSMDHGGSDGLLRIYGEYVASGGTDHWSYATDFDGTDLLATSAERAVSVEIAAGGAATYLNGGLSVIGTSSATTTINNQGSGTYSLIVGDSASTTWRYVSVRSIDAAGLTLGGTAGVHDLAYLDLSADINGASSMTIAGSVIDANPAKNFTGDIFRLGGGVSGASNVTVTGTSVSSWRFANHSGGFDGEANDNDSGDPGEIVWTDSAALITVSGNVYSDEGTTGSGVGICNGVTQNVRLVVAGLNTYTTSCAFGSGAYSIPNVSFNSNDTLTVYIDNGVGSGATISIDPISNISNMDIYEQRVIVRHENTDPVTIADLAAWDSSDDTDIPFTAVDAGSDTLTLDTGHKLIVWTNKTFAPAGSIVVPGGSASAYDGTVELYDDAVLTMTGTDTLTVGGSFLSGTDSIFTAANSTVEFTSISGGRTVNTNEAAFYDLIFSGSGAWDITNANVQAHDVVISSGAVTLPTGTSTISGSFDATGGNFDYNSGSFLFTSASGGEVVAFDGSAAGPLTFTGAGSWAMTDTNATTTGTIRIEAGTVTLPSGILAVADSFTNNSTVNHNNGTIQLSGTTSSVITANGSDLNNVTVIGVGPYTITDNSIALLGDLTIANGTLTLASGTTAIGGSLLTQSGGFEHASGTVLFNSSDTGETITVNGSDFYNVQFNGVGGGWTVTDSATTTKNFTLTNANTFTQASGTTLFVGGVFNNAVGGSATEWTGTTLVLESGSAYSINTKVAGGDHYDSLVIGNNTDIRSWNSSATSTSFAQTSSWYSQDHQATDGALSIYGDFHIGTTSEYWSYATDFDGTVLSGGARRPVTVAIADTATTTVDGGSLVIAGESGNETLVTNQGGGTYALAVTAGNFSANYYQFRNLDGAGLAFSGTPVISTLSNGDFELAVNGGSLITLATETLNANASKVFNNVRFATTTAITGTNINLAATSSNAWRFTSHTGNLAGEAYDVDGITDCGSIRWEDSACLLIEQTHYRWRLDDGSEGAPDSEWYDTNWSRRQSVRIENSDNVQYSSVPVRVTIPYDADMQADFDDIRFTDESGTTTLPYWIEKVNAGNEAEAWVLVPTLVADAYSKVFLYYGNATATTTSDGSAVFDFFDDFEDGNVTEYSGTDASLFSAGTSFNYGGNYGLDASGHENDRALNGGMYQTGSQTATGKIIRYLQYVDTASGSADETCTLFAVQSASNNYAVCIEQVSGTDRISLAKNVTDVDTSGTVLSSSTVAYTTGWYEVEIDWQSGGQIDVTLWRAGSIVATVSASDTDYSSGGVGFTYWFQHGGWDSYVVHDRIATRPVVYLGAEQQRSGATWAAPLDTPSSAYQIGDTARLRFVIENSGLDKTGQQFLLEAAPKGTAPSCEAVPNSSYNAVPVLASCGSDPLCMATSTNVSNGVATTDHLEAAGSFTAGRVVANVANITSSLDMLQNEFTEVEYVLTPTVNVADEAYCLRVTDNGIALDSYTSVAELSLQFEPTFGPVTLNGGSNIVLSLGTTTTIFATGTVTDLNGYADLVAATSTIYRSGAGAACTEDTNNCYISSGALCSFTACAGASCTLSCQADIYYYAEPTDSGAYVGEEWLAYLEVADGTGSVGFGSAPGVELSTIRGLDVINDINYGALAVDSDTGSLNASTTMQNLGNDAIDIRIVGSDLSDGDSSIIPATDQIFATSTFTYSTCVTCTNLTTSAIDYEVDLAKPTQPTPPVTDTIYWGLYVPFGTASNLHSGNNTFYAISDS